MRKVNTVSSIVINSLYNSFVPSWVSSCPVGFHFLAQTEASRLLHVHFLILVQRLSPILALKLLLLTVDFLLLKLDFLSLKLDSLFLKCKLFLLKLLRLHFHFSLLVELKCFFFDNWNAQLPRS